MHDLNYCMPDLNYCMPDLNYCGITAELLRNYCGITAELLSNRLNYCMPEKIHRVGVVRAQSGFPDQCPFLPSYWCF